MSDKRPIDGYIDPNFPPPGGPNDTPIVIYGYTPAIALSAFAAIWFFIFLLIHSYQVFRFRSWYFVTFPVGLILEIIGYIARSLSSQKNPYSLPYFIINYFAIVTAPVFFAAGIYTVLSVLINKLGAQYSFLKPKIVLAFFITSDVIATITQVAGAALIGVAQSNRDDPTTANNILLGGLSYQVFSMTVFIILTGSFMFRARLTIAEAKLTVFCAVYAIAAILIYIRTIFRLAETGEGLMGELMTNEIYFAILEFAPVAAAVMLYAWWFPGKHVGSKVRQQHVVDGAGREKGTVGSGNSLEA